MWGNARGAAQKPCDWGLISGAGEYTAWMGNRQVKQELCARCRPVITLRSQKCHQVTGVLQCMLFTKAGQGR